MLLRPSTLLRNQIPRTLVLVWPSTPERPHSPELVCFLHEEERDSGKEDLQPHQQKSRAPRHIGASQASSIHGANYTGTPAEPTQRGTPLMEPTNQAMHPLGAVLTCGQGNHDQNPSPQSYRVSCLGENFVPGSGTFTFSCRTALPDHSS